MVIIEDAKGNQLLDLLTGNKKLQRLHAVKNKYRNKWELTGGIINDNETIPTIPKLYNATNG